jgi:hypothetical protein
MAVAGAAPRRRGPRFGSRQRGNKFGAVKAKVGDLTFDSQREARRWQQLQLELRAGEVRELLRQVPFAITATTPRGDTVTVAKYIADFTYERKQPDGSWRSIVEDAKGVRTDVFNLKKKLVEAIHGIEILLT